MSGLRGYSLYKDYHLYLPQRDELIRGDEGGFQVHAIISSFPYSEVALVKIPDCVAGDVEEAMGLSMTHAMRLAEDGWRPSACAPEAGVMR